jgi:hypothetical protein
MRKFTEEEIKEIIRTAQLFAPQLSDKQYEKLIQMQQELADSEFIEAAWGVHRLEQEYGISCSQAEDKYLELLKDTAKTESELAQLHKERELEEKSLRETSVAIQQAREKHSYEERQLKDFKRQAENEKKRLEKELEQARKEAQVSQEEVATTGKLKTKLESHKLDLELTLRLFEEFAHDEDAAMLFAQGREEYGSQTKARESLREENETLRVENEKGKEESDRMKAECQQQQEVLSRLKSNIAEEEALRHFHRRFQGASGTMEYLARWPQIIPMRCHWFSCGARFWVDTGPTNFRTKFICPCCGIGQVYYDDEAFIAQGITYRAPFRIQLEE